MLKRETKPVGMLGCNCTLIGDDDTLACYIVDPGGDGFWIRERIAAHGWTPKAILLTHAHIDHVVAAKELSEEYQIPVRMHPGDEGLYALMDKQALFLGLPHIQAPVLGSPLKDREEFSDLRVPLQVIHTPGHTHGSVCIYVDDGEGLLLTGDTLFKQGIGRWDIGGISMEAILMSIRDRLLKLPEQTIVVPGHGEETTLALEKRENPYLQMIR